MPSGPSRDNSLLEDDNRMSDAEIEKQINQFELKERREFDSAGGDGPGWTWGEATDPGFRKQ
jgi:hypothetical protein